MKRMAAVLALAVSTLLSGCFISDNPMFPAASAVRPLEAGRYALFERDGDANKPDEYMDIKLREDGGYDFINEKGAVTPVSFHAIAGGLHVAQVRGVPTSQSDPARKGYGYALFKVDGREAQVYVLECDKQDRAKMIALGVELRGQYECGIDRVADAAAFFAGLDKGRVSSRMRRE
jgi:hypothetical protein